MEALNLVLVSFELLIMSRWFYTNFGFSNFIESESTPTSTDSILQSQNISFYSDHSATTLKTISDVENINGHPDRSELDVQNLGDDDTMSDVLSHARSL